MAKISKLPIPKYEEINSEKEISQELISSIISNFKETISFIENPLKSIDENTLETNINLEKTNSLLDIKPDSSQSSSPEFQKSIDENTLETNINLESIDSYLKSIDENTLETNINLEQLNKSFDSIQSNIVKDDSKSLEDKVEQKYSSTKNIQPVESDIPALVPDASKDTDGKKKKSLSMRTVDYFGLDKQSPIVTDAFRLGRSAIKKVGGAAASLFGSNVKPVSIKKEDSISTVNENLVKLTDAVVDLKPKKDLESDLEAKAKKDKNVKPEKQSDKTKESGGLFGGLIAAAAGLAGLFVSLGSGVTSLIGTITSGVTGLVTGFASFGSSISKLLPSFSTFAGLLASPAMLAALAAFAGIKAVDTLFDNDIESARKKAENDARKAGKSEQEIKEAGDRAAEQRSSEHTKTITNTGSTDGGLSESIIESQSEENKVSAKVTEEEQKLLVDAPFMTKYFGYDRTQYVDKQKKNNEILRDWAEKIVTNITTVEVAKSKLSTEHFNKVMEMVKNPDPSLKSVIEKTSKKESATPETKNIKKETTVETVQSSDAIISENTVPVSNYKNPDVTLSNKSSELSNKNLSPEVQKNLQGIKAALESRGITNPEYINATLANVMKETGGRTIEENLNYSTTSNSRIREIFSSRVANKTDEELNIIKSSPKEFGELVYGSNTQIGKALGNTEPGDGFKYRGRGFIQITGKSNYASASKAIFGDTRLVENPDLATDPAVASQITAWYMESGQKGMSKKLGIDLKNMSQEDANLLATSQVAGRVVKRGDSGYISNELLSKVDAYSNNKSITGISGATSQQPTQPQQTVKKEKGLLPTIVDNVTSFITGNPVDPNKPISDLLFGLITPDGGNLKQYGDTTEAGYALSANIVAKKQSMLKSQLESKMNTDTSTSANEVVKELSNVISEPIAPKESAITIDVPKQQSIMTNAITEMKKQADESKEQKNQMVGMGNAVVAPSSSSSSSVSNVTNIFNAPDLDSTVRRLSDMSMFKNRVW